MKNIVVSDATAISLRFQAGPSWRGSTSDRITAQLFNGDAFHVFPLSMARSASHIDGDKTIQQPSTWRFLLDDDVPGASPFPWPAKRAAGFTIIPPTTATLEN